MRHIDIRDLPNQTDDEIRSGMTIAVERDGEILGYFLPRRKMDPKELEAAFSRLDATIEGAIKNGYTRERLAEDLDLSKPFRDDV
jgi:hypothetical protein